MENKDQSKEITPEQKHQRQFLLEVILPLAIVLLVFLSLTALAIFFTSANATILAQWSAISVILMVIPVLILCLIACVVVILLNQLLGKWNKGLPPLALLIRTKYAEWALKIQNIVKLPAEPLIKVGSFTAAIKQFIASLRNQA